MDDTISSYILKKQLIEAIVDPLNPVSSELRANITVSQLEQLKQDVSAMEDNGIGLIASLRRTKNF